MEKESYRFIVRCLSLSIVLLVIASIFFGVVRAFGVVEADAAQLVPVLAPVATLLGGLLVVPPK